MSEDLIGGGTLVSMRGAGLAAEGVPGAKRGRVVVSGSAHASDGRMWHACYRLTQRAVRGADLWRVRAHGRVEVSR